MSATTTRKTVASAHERLDAMEATLGRIESLLTASLTPGEPARVSKPQPKADEPNEFVTWLRESAEARHARKASNREMADWLRSKGLPTSGPVWEAAKAGERKVTVLRKLA